MKSSLEFCVILFQSLLRSPPQNIMQTNMFHVYIMREEVNITSQQECVSPHNKRLSCVSPHKQVLIRLVFVCMFLSKVLESSQQELVLCKSSQASPHKTSIYGQEVPQCPGIDQYVKICLTIAGMFHQVLQSLGSVTIPQYICISRCQASFHKVASL